MHLSICSSIVTRFQIIPPLEVDPHSAPVLNHPTIHYPLPTIHSPLPTPHYPFPTIHSPLSLPHYPLPTIHYPFPIPQFRKL
ncbi:MAG: hypothetical protein ACP5I1_16480 [Candidatus Hinthialibacter sp.]